MDTHPIMDAYYLDNNNNLADSDAAAAVAASNQLIYCSPPDSGFLVLGSPIGKVPYVNNYTAKVCTGATQVLEKISTFSNVTLKLSLASVLTGQCRLNHLIRSVPTTADSEHLALLLDCDEKLQRKVIQDFLGGSADAPSFDRARELISLPPLPFTLRPASTYATCAFLGAQAGNRLLGQRLQLPHRSSEELPAVIDYHNKHFPGNDALSFLQSRQAAIDALATADLNSRNDDRLAPPLGDPFAFWDQKMWSKALNDVRWSNFRKNHPDPVDLAVIAACRARGALAVLTAPLFPEMDRSSLTNTQALTAARIALRLPVHDVPYRCSCQSTRQAEANVYGDHVQKCARLITSRHNHVRSAITRELTIAGRPFVLEKTIPGSNLRPGDFYLAHGLSSGVPTYHDIGVSFAGSHPELKWDHNDGVAAAALHASDKNQKYASAIPAGTAFIPLTLQSTGGMGLDLRFFISKLAAATSQTRGVSTQAAAKIISRNITASLWRDLANAVQFANQTRAGRSNLHFNL